MGTEVVEQETMTMHFTNEEEDPSPEIMMLKEVPEDVLLLEQQEPSESEVAILQNQVKLVGSWIHEGYSEMGMLHNGHGHGPVEVVHDGMIMVTPQDHDHLHDNDDSVAQSESETLTQLTPVPIDLPLAPLPLQPLPSMSMSMSIPFVQMGTRIDEVQASESLIPTSTHEIIDQVGLLDDNDEEQEDREAGEIISGNANVAVEVEVKTESESEDYNDYESNHERSNDKVKAIMPAKKIRRCRSEGGVSRASEGSAGSGGSRASGGSGTGEDKEFACSTCGKTFGIKWNLIAHVRIHTGERPFACAGCEQRFRQYAHLQKHMRSVHPGTPIPPRATITTKTGTETSNSRPVSGIPKQSIKKKANNGNGKKKKMASEDDDESDEEIQKKLKNKQKGKVNRINNGRSNRVIAKKEIKKVVKTIRASSKSTKCRTCGKICASSDSLEIHSRLHTGEKPYHCPCCPKRHRQWINLKQHMLRYHPSRPVPPYWRATSTIVHVPQEENNDPYKRFNLRDCSVVLTRYDVDDGGPMSTQMVRQKFDSMVSGTEGRNLALQLKSEGKQCRVEIDSQLLSAFLEPIFPMPPVDFNSYCKSQEKSHRRREKMRGKLSSLANVGTKPTRKSQWSSDKKAKREFKYKCTKCGKRFTSQRSLSIHNARYHHLDKKMNVSQSSNLSHLVKSRNPRGNFACEFCPRQFGRLDIWKKHMQVHDQTNKKLQCKICGKYFATTTNLYFHKRIHTGERPFACKECGKSFTRKDVLLAHVRIHTGEKPFECKACNKAYRTISALQHHKRNMHYGEEACYRCQICHSQFVDLESLTQHSSTSH